MDEWRFLTCVDSQPLQLFNHRSPSLSLGTTRLSSCSVTSTPRSAPGSSPGKPSRRKAVPSDSGSCVETLKRTLRDSLPVIVKEEEVSCHEDSLSDASPKAVHFRLKGPATLSPKALSLPRVSPSPRKSLRQPSLMPLPSRQEQIREVMSHAVSQIKSSLDFSPDEEESLNQLLDSLHYTEMRALYASQHPIQCQLAQSARSNFRTQASRVETLRDPAQPHPAQVQLNRPHVEVVSLLQSPGYIEQLPDPPALCSGSEEDCKLLTLRRLAKETRIHVVTRAEEVVTPDLLCICANLDGDDEHHSATEASDAIQESVRKLQVLGLM